LPLDVVYPLTWFGNTTDGDGATPVVLAAGASQDLAISLRPVPALRLRVQFPDADSGRVPAIALTVEGPGGSRMGVDALRSSGPGYILLRGLTPGRYVLRVTGFDASNGLRTDYPRAVDLTGDQTVAVPGPPQGVISGTIVSDTPLAGSDSVVLRSPSGGDKAFVARVEPGAKVQAGTYAAAFRFDAEPVPPGRYEVTLQSQGSRSLGLVVAPDLAVTFLAVNGSPISDRLVSVSEDDVEITVHVLHTKPARVEGVVTKDGAPAAGVTVFLVPDDAGLRGSFTFRAETASDGSFAIPQVAPGRYAAFAIDDGLDLEYAKPGMAEPYLAHGLPVDVAAGAKLQLQLPVLPN
jgi:hypothetical protein